MNKSDVCSQYAAGLCTTLVTGLTRPTSVAARSSVAAGSNGAVYSSNRGNSAAVGQVIRIQP